MMKQISTTELSRHSYGCVDYMQSMAAMHEFVDQRNSEDPDEVWFLQHHPVFTLGRNGSRENILISSNIPVVHADRGGDVTYHAPGQLIVYCLFDLKRLGIGVKSLVSGLEQLVIDFLQTSGVQAHRIEQAPGVYVEGKKIASLGLRVRNGYTFHGLAINVNMDLTPFSYIHPCGLQNMQVTQMTSLGIKTSCEELEHVIYDLMVRQFYS